MTAVTFDFAGHGRNPTPMSRDVGRLEGTTAQLVDQTEQVLAAARDRLDLHGPAALVGHSMATDVIVRAARDAPAIAAVVAISMYSEAVTPEHPDRLLVISGAWEPRLREVALAAVHQIDADAGEGETGARGGVVRRAVAAPRVEHVGVLYSPTTLREARAWIAEATGVPVPADDIAITGPWIALLLAALLLLAYPVLARLGPPAPRPRPLPARLFTALLFTPVPFAAAGAALAGGEVMGFAEIGRLVVFLGLWGGAQLVVLARAGWRPASLEARGSLLLLGCALVFALALDRYGASFVPAGPRVGVMAALLPGTIAFMLADATLMRAGSWWQRIIVRALPLAVLTALMVALPGRMGLLFTALPVLVLFFLVYGMMGRWTARRASPMSAGLALGIVLAWSLAATTPLFAGAGAQ